MERGNHQAKDIMLQLDIFLSLLLLSLSNLYQWSRSKSEIFLTSTTTPLRANSITRRGFFAVIFALSCVPPYLIIAQSVHASFVTGLTWLASVVRR
ncbi:hypothetical protein BU25DRAFT_210998 [Macroventuria anomochaeta]|uniref:Uncharacterized protein n=1 Tax=Macroventuria anomochaeta TaxID=301207 RepID=A0ACB6RLF0_9PLEO|nr:uncharacterized protein BU25DRAFT_210998 [Macroventuria anomochaeta]KAF2622558.1 hypothetical protein BU25DRAFT_210998 [Macroventuria anomochaeta]